MGTALSLDVVPMKKSTKSVRCKKSPPAWHAAFEEMLPIIERHAKIAFRQLGRESREEAVQETVCYACQAYCRLVETGKANLAFPSVLARFGVRQTREGRKVGGTLNCRDMLSDYCRQKKNLLVERLDRYDSEEQAWREILIEDKNAGPAATAMIRLDFSAWLQQLPPRLRKIASFLARGESTTAAAKRFRVSQSRISQVRGELFLAWRRFQGEELAMAAA
jgi:hypothetical protein